MSLILGVAGIFSFTEEFPTGSRIGLINYHLLILIPLQQRISSAHSIFNFVILFVYFSSHPHRMILIRRRWVGVENDGKYLMHSFIYYLGGKHNTRNRKGRILKVDNECIDGFCLFFYIKFLS